LQRISFPYDKEVSCPAVDSDAEIGDLIENDLEPSDIDMWSLML